MATAGEQPRPQRSLSQQLGFFLGLMLFFLLLGYADLKPDQPAPTRMAAVAALMAVWWITDAIPLAATALLPLVLYPLLGILSGRETAPIYVNDIIFLFIGGFLIALAMERWNLHRRIALRIIRTVGGGPARLVLSFLLASAFLSMWISNTATAIMMLAIGLAIIAQQEAAFGKDKTHNLSVALLLAIAYGSSIGGMATLVGTPPNLSLARIFGILFPRAEPITFGQWFLLGVPLSLVLLGFVWVLLARVFFHSPPELQLSREVIQAEHDTLGPIQFEEVVVAVVFGLTAVLWVFRVDLTLGEWTLPGWVNLLPEVSRRLIDDGTVAIGMALLLFLIPARSQLARKKGRTAVLEVGVFQQLPWHIVLLFGGGFALAKGFQSTGLSTWIGSGFTALAGTSPLLLVVVVCFILTFLTELTSNTATTEMVLPILASVAVAMETNPLLLLIPATLSASCAFMLPVATPPNAIVFGSGHLRIGQMVLVGLVINLIGVVVITFLFLTIGTAVFEIDLSTFPDWAVTR